MARPALEVADIFRDHGPAWREANRGHVSHEQFKVMNAIENCRTAALGGHVARCEDSACGHTVIAYNSCRNRHCGKCQGSAAREWLEAREAELLPVPYFHVVFTLPAEIADIAYQNKAVIYDLLFKVSADVMTTIAADPRHLGARIAITSVLHTWGSAMMHHPHVHMIVPGVAVSPDGSNWIRASARFLLPVKVLSALFRRRMIEALIVAHKAGRLDFFNDLALLADATAFATHLEPLKAKRWHVYAKRPFGGPQAVLAYLARYTHRVAISNRRLIKADASSVTFKVKDYRIDGPGRYKTMTVHRPSIRPMTTSAARPSATLQPTRRQCIRAAARAAAPASSSSIQSRACVRRGRNHHRQRSCIRGWTRHDRSARRRSPLRRSLLSLATHRSRRRTSRSLRKCTRARSLPVERNRPQHRDRPWGSRHRGEPARAARPLPPIRARGTAADRQIPIDARQRRGDHQSRVPSLEAFRRRPPCSWPHPRRAVVETVPQKATFVAMAMADPTVWSTLSAAKAIASPSGVTDIFAIAA